MEKIFQDLIKKIKNNSQIQPILFLWENQEILTNEIEKNISQLLNLFWVDKGFVFRLLDDWEKIKIEILRQFVWKWDIKPSFWFQIFLIENISRFTNESANSCLKFFEEPWIWNIIFLTNKSESKVLETILSRVKIVNFFSQSSKSQNNFYINLIDDFLNKKNQNLLKYFFDDKKLEKKDYIEFFENFLIYSQNNLEYSFLIENILQSIDLIKNQNVLPKYEVDKIILFVDKNFW